MKSNIVDMKAPDKVYIRSRAFETPWPAYIDENANYGGEQYIRKDALVERINKQILFYQNSVPVNDYEEGCNKGAIAALEHIVKSL